MYTIKTGLSTHHAWLGCGRKICFFSLRSVAKSKDCKFVVLAVRLLQVDHTARQKLELGVYISFG